MTLNGVEPGQLRTQGRPAVERRTALERLFVTIVQVALKLELSNAAQQMQVTLAPHSFGTLDLAGDGRKFDLPPFFLGANSEELSTRNTTSPRVTRTRNPLGINAATGN
jgi:hypothetical protein